MTKENVYDATLGEFVEIEVDNQPDPNEQAGIEQGVRIERNNLLMDSDWTVLPDSTLTAEQKN